MTDKSELWKVNEFNTQMVVGKKTRNISAETIEFDSQAAQELFGDLAGSALADYLQVESLADDPAVRSGMPPRVVEPAQAQANKAKTIFHEITHQSIDSVLQSRPKPRQTSL